MTSSDIEMKRACSGLVSEFVFGLGFTVSFSFSRHEHGDWNAACSIPCGCARTAFAVESLFLTRRLRNLHLALRVVREQSVRVCRASRRTSAPVGDEYELPCVGRVHRHGHLLRHHCESHKGSGTERLRRRCVILLSVLL